MDNEATSMSDDLDAAWEESAENSAEEAPELSLATEQEAEVAPVEAEAEPVAEAEPAAEAEQAVEAEDVPPKSLSLAAREAWKDTPKAVRDDIAKREADVEKGMRKYGEDAHRAQNMDKVLPPDSQ